jgi:hypothetical protein
MQSYLIQRLLGTIDRATYTWWQMFLGVFQSNLCASIISPTLLRLLK